MKKLILAAFTTVISPAAIADVLVQFDEGAPKDSFTITNAGTCPLENVLVRVDIAPAGLIFDVTGAGAGVSVFQPLEIVSGKAFLSSTPKVVDGDTNLELPVKSLPQNATISFTIDVDEAQGATPTMVTGSEILGATVVVSTSGSDQSGQFSEKASARVPFNACRV